MSMMGKCISFMSLESQMQSLMCIKLCAMYSVVCSLQPHGPQPTRLLCPGDFPGKDIAVGAIGRQILYQWATWEAKEFIRNAISDAPP